MVAVLSTMVAVVYTPLVAVSAMSAVLRCSVKCVVELSKVAACVSAAPDSLNINIKTALFHCTVEVYTPEMARHKIKKEIWQDRKLKIIKKDNTYSIFHYFYSPFCFRKTDNRMNFEGVGFLLGFVFIFAKSCNWLLVSS